MKAAVATSLVAAFAGMAVAYPQSSPSPSSSPAAEIWSPAPDGTECTKHSDCGGCGPNNIQLLEDARGDFSTPMECSACMASPMMEQDYNTCSTFQHDGAELEALLNELVKENETN
ncbi:hypothetical protein VFPBJ_02981 [Purpureocillium lilacinum]|uniref:Uncharacterized protein n=1 Tax=Purpureocillium lilacinum TaxID=33203 RepID=A0A179H3Y0_PURLI|nr:hypothetical protein VFPBJ_02981 [Purpureocillium lilacinum]